MKKTLAILLSCMLIVCAICAVALSTNAEVVPASEVKVTTSAGETTLNATTTSVACTTGTATFDATTGTLTLNGTTGITKINGSGAGLLTVKVEGTNTVDGTGVDNIVWNAGGDLAVTGTGTLNIKGRSYLLGGNGDVTLDGPTINANNTSGTNVHIGANALDGVLTIKGNTVLNVTNAGGGRAIDLAGIAPKLVVTDNAKVTISTTDTGINIRVSKNATAAIPKCSATAEISGKAQVNILNGNQALQTILDDNATNKALTNTGFVGSVTIKDEASFKSVTKGQGIVVNAEPNWASTDKAILQILDKATVDIDTTANSGQYSQCIDVRGGYGSSGSSDVDITTTGTVKVKSNAHTWNGAVIFRGNGGHDILIKDTKMTIENVPSNYHQVSVGLYCQVKATSFVIAGDAEITVSAKQDTFDTMVVKDADKTNRANGFYISSGTNLTVKDNAKINASVDGNAAKSWAAGAAAIYVNNSTMTIQDNAVVTGTAKGIAIPAFVSQQGNLIVKGNAKLNLDGSLNGILLNNDTTKAKDTITVTEGGVITAKGATASVAKNNDHYTIDAAQKGLFTDKTIIFAAKTVAAPTNVAASDVTANSAKITWTAVAGATSYKVYSGASLLTTVNTNEAVIDTMPSTAYSITVKAVNVADAESAASAAATFTTPAGQATVVAPAAPTNVKVSAITQTSAKVTWNAVEGATTYDVYLGTNKVTTVDTTEATLADLTAETAYKVTVKATNVAGASPASAEVSFKTAKKNGAASIDVILANGTTITLNSDNTSTTGATGTIVFDPIESTVTLTDVTGVQAVIGATNVNLTYVIKGTNTLETATQVNVLRAYDLTVIGDGTLNVKSTLTTTTSYTILGQKNITIGGNVTFNLENAAGNAMHVARGLVSNSDEDSVCTFTFKDNAKIRVKTLAGNTVYGTGHKVSLIITDKADVKLECAVKSDIIHLKADTIGKNRSIAPGTYFEVSGDAKLVVPDGNCAYRGQYNIADAKIDADATIAAIAAVNAVVFKGNAQVEMAAQGQVVYPCNNTVKATVNSKQSIEISDNANVKFTSKGAYVSLQLGLSGKKNENAFTFNGGKLILDGGASAKGYAVNGKTTYTFGENVVVKTGDNKDSLTEVENPASVSTSAKYILIEKVAADDNTGNTGNSGNSGNAGNTGNTGNSGTTNPGTSDFAPVAAVVAVLATVAVAAVVVLRKRSENE